MRDSIERGLTQCEKCVVVLSKNFFENGGWTKMEFETIIQREILEKQLVLLPVWHGITKAELFAYSPQLLNRFAAIWPGPDGAGKVAHQMLAALGRV